ncbi:sarcosine oxidase subunit delta [Celeribacter sp.]|uniref:sarcosine oxidase subunit delta n=1 Tax=Celeribacter sp. TaxID=1890673 RepID=UPI002AA95265|nr:sarcosine oxidase subunit delta [uncultured Celeribacter sp.]
MLQIFCPYCEELLPETEFVYAGEAHIDRPVSPSEQTDEEWAEFLFMRKNVKGIHFERWRHIHGCGRYFNVVRNTITDKIIVTYKAGEPQPDLSKILEEQNQ